MVHLSLYLAGRHSQESTSVLKGKHKEQKGGCRRHKGPYRGNEDGHQVEVADGSRKDWDDRSLSVPCKGETSKIQKENGPVVGGNFPNLHLGGSVSAGKLIYDSAIKKCNSLAKSRECLSPVERVSSAERIWNIGSPFGGLKESIIKKIKNMEDRDQKGVSSSGGKSGVK